MTLSRIIFLTSLALLTLTSCHAWAIVQGLRQTRPHGLKQIMQPLALLLAVLTMSLSSCGFQQYTKPDGSKISNVTGLSKTRLEVRPDGTVIMAANAEKAADTLGKYGDGLLKLRAFKLGTDALQSVGNNAIDAVR